MSECSVGDPEQRRHHVALICASTDDGRLLTSSTNLIWTVVDWLLQVAGPDASMHVGTLAALAGEMAGYVILIFISGEDLVLATYILVCTIKFGLNGDKSCDISKSVVCCLLRLGP